MCISSNSVNQAQDLMSVTKFEDFPNSLIPINYPLDNLQRSLKKSRRGKQEAGCQVALRIEGKGRSLSAETQKRRKSIADVEL